MNILITGSNGFIGYNLSKSLSSFHYVIGVDNDDSSDWVKKIRSSNKQVHTFYNVSINDTHSLSKIMKENAVDIVIHLAAKAGVRKSFESKYEYIDTNVNGFFSVLDAMLEANVKKLIFASSSSIYGNAAITNQISQESIYAITKATDEMIASLYSKQYNLDIVGCRFFTVYGEYGRADMAALKWARQLLNNETLTIYGDGTVARDFTYVGDVVDAITRLINYDFSNYNVYDIGCGEIHSAVEFVEELARVMNKNALITYSELSKQDALLTKSDTRLFEEKYGKLKHTSIKDGINKLVKWLKEYESYCINDFVA